MDLIIDFIGAHPFVTFVLLYIPIVLLIVWALGRNTREEIDTYGARVEDLPESFSYTATLRSPPRILLPGEEPPAE